MSWLKELGRRLSHLGRRSRFERDLEQEMEFHIETRAEELEKSGLARREALAQARREFGPAARAREETRTVWQIRWLEDLTSDLSYALRAFRRNPGFALAAIVSLALGIGANTTIFSLTMEFLFSQPSCRRPETLAAMRIGGSSHSPMREYRFLRDAHVFEGLAGSREEAEVNWRHGDETSRLYIMRVTDNFFDVVGVPVAMGRAIESGDRNAVVLSYRFWQSRLDGNPDVLGRLLVLDGQSYTVAGILPRDHRTLMGFGFSPDLYLPVTSEKEIVAFVARLPEGMSRPAAMARLTSACEELDRVFPREFGRWSRGIEVRGVIGIDHLKSKSVRPVAAFFGLLMVVVGLVLLIACANVASLLLARASSRRQELAIRLAIGAGRGRLVRQLLAESLLLAVMGTAAGLLLNVWLAAFVNRLHLPLPIPIQLMIQPDWRLLSYATAVALASALLCGLMPALKATRADVNVALKQQERQVGSRRWNLRNALVIGQLAMSMVLLTTGFLFLRNLMKATSMNPGFDVERTVWAYMRLVPEKYPTRENILALISTGLDRLRAVPGVEAASVARGVPLNSANTSGLQARTDLNDNPIRVHFNHNWVSPDYFRAMGIPILEGREFEPSDRRGGPWVVILNENLARRLFGDSSPVGHIVRFELWGPVTVVGVARNSKYFTLGEENAQALYTPFLQLPAPNVDIHFLVRSSLPPQTLLKELNAVLGGLDRSASIEIKPMRNALFLAFLPSRAGAALLGSLGVLGLVLASIGLYGVLVYAVSRRIREIGVRVALGAGPGDILRMVFGESFLLVGIGIAIGLAIAVFATRPLAMFLVPGLSPTDVTAFVSVVGVLVAVAFVATVGPALRALRVDPMVALRWE